MAEQIAPDKRLLYISFMMQYLDDCVRDWNWRYALKQACYYRQKVIEPVSLARDHAGYCDKSGANCMVCDHKKTSKDSIAICESENARPGFCASENVAGPETCKSCKKWYQDAYFGHCPKHSFVLSKPDQKFTE